MIEFRDISLLYGGETVISGLSFKVDRGDKAVILGRSGTGKSSLFSALLGFKQPGQGNVLFEGRPVDERNCWEIRKKISYIDQDVSLGDGTVSSRIEFAANLRANSKSNFNDNRISELLSIFELGRNVLNKNIEELSGGERQRIAIIISLLLNRKVFLLDEVTSSLDSSLKEKVAEYFLSKDEWTVLVISHDRVWLDSPGVRVFDIRKKRWRQ